MARPLPRLKRRADFLRLARQGRKWAAPGLILQASAHAREGQGRAAGMRVGFTASRKIGKAVARNRCRRRLKAVALKVLPTEAREGFDFVLIARAKTLSRPFDALARDLETALRKVGAHRDGEGRP